MKLTDETIPELSKLPLREAVEKARREKEAEDQVEKLVKEVENNCGGPFEIEPLD